MIRLLLITALSLHASIACTQVDEVSHNDLYKLDYGLLIKSGENKVELVKSTEVISKGYLRNNPELGFGYMISKLNKPGFFHHAIIKMPVPEIYEGNKVSEVDVYDDTLMVKVNKTYFESYAYYFVQLDVGDRVGEYNMDIYIDDKLYSHIKFNVVD